MASNGIIKSLTNVEGVGFGSERRATLQFYFDRRISFVKHAVQRITIIISPPYVFEEGGRGRGCVRAHTPPYPPVPTSTSTEFHFCKLFFHFVVSREHAAFLPPFSSKPRKHDKSSLSLSLSLVSFSSAHVVSSSFFFVPR